MCPLDAASGQGGTRPFLPDLLARVAHLLTKRFAEELRGRSVSLPVWRALAALEARPCETVTGLAEACLLQQPTMTKLLDRMVLDGLVTRVPDARDRRIVRVALTPEGEAKAAELAAIAGRHEAEMLARHPQAEAIKPVLRDIAAGGAATRRGGGRGEGGRGEEGT
ncbi:MAG TPA: MarR family transcriptional regulator [Acetobacteraceae bacterium]|nr:MarR family transcriptional regulator [Acetobacteraceae bacterium]